LATDFGIKTNQINSTRLISIK